MDSANVKRRLTCILATDAVGYSGHMAADEEGTIKVLAAHRAVIDGIIGFHEGRIVGTAGDSVLAEFHSAVNAVRCASEIQEALKTRNDALPEHQRLLFRIGVNLGDVVIKDQDLLGDGVNIAARLESLAEPGGICISSSVYDQITGKLNLGFQDIGEQTLKNIGRPVRVYRVADALPIAPSATPANTHGARSPATQRPTWLWGMLAGAGVVASAGALAWANGWLRWNTPPAPAQAVSPPATAPTVATAAAPTAPPPPTTTPASAAPASAAPASAAPASAAPASAAPPTVAAAPTPKPTAPPAPSISAAPRPKLQRPAPPPETSRSITPAVREAAAHTALARTALPEAPPPNNQTFDGAWRIHIRCASARDGAQAYVVLLDGVVTQGWLRAERPAQQGANHLLIEGLIQANGRAHLLASGTTGNPRFTMGQVPEGTAFKYQIDAFFSDNKGTGQRQGARTCDLDFQRR